jgi:large-conductance mechanosensitive channel
MSNDNNDNDIALDLDLDDLKLDVNDEPQEELSLEQLLKNVIQFIITQRSTFTVGCRYYRNQGR